MVPDDSSPNPNRRTTPEELPQSDSGVSESRSDLQTQGQKPSEARVAKSRTSGPPVAQPETAWRFHPLAAIWGFILPGAGHLWLGETQRGLIVGGFIFGLFIVGLLIGGIDVIDRRAADAPFIRVGQVFLAPSWVADWCRLAILEPAATPQDIAPGRYSPSFSRIQEQGVLYTAVAGLLNLMAIIDLMYRPERRGAQ